MGFSRSDEPSPQDFASFTVLRVPFMKTWIPHAFGVRFPSVVRRILPRRYDRGNLSCSGGGGFFEAGPRTTLPSPFSLFPFFAATGLASAFSIGACASLSLGVAGVAGVVRGVASEERTPGRDLVGQLPPQLLYPFLHLPDRSQALLAFGDTSFDDGFQIPCCLVESGTCDAQGSLHGRQILCLGHRADKVTGEMGREEA